MANVLLISGNLTRDPELRVTPAGKSVASFGIASNERYGENEITTFVDVTAWEKQADLADEYLRKGSKVLIEGKLKYETWEDKETGQKRSKHSIVAQRIEFLDRKPADTTSEDKPETTEPVKAKTTRKTTKNKPAPTEPTPESDSDISDIPF